MVNDKSRSASGGFFHVFSLDIVDLDLIVVPAFGVPGSQGSGFLKGTVRQLFALGPDYYMGTRNSFGMHGTTSHCHWQF